MAVSEPAQRSHLGKPSEADERRIVEAAQQNPACFGDVYERYFEFVYGFIARRVRDRHTTEDLTSEVFRKALASLPRFKWTGAPFGAWLIRIAANLIADRAKKAARENSISQDTLTIPDVGRVQMSDVEAAEDHAYVVRMVDELPEDQRRVIRMRFAEEKSISEIAVALDRSEGAVKQLQFRALGNLRKKLTAEGLLRSNE